MINIKQPSGHHLIELKNQIVRNFNDSHWRELAMLTDTYEMVTTHPRLLRSLSFGDDDYEGNVIEIIKSIIDADPNNYDKIKDYVAHICPENGEFVSSTNDGTRRIIFSPNVFKVPDGKPNLQLVSVMMPFDTEMRPVYDVVKSAAISTGYVCKKADDIWDDYTVIQDIFSLIFQSYVVVCDFTGKNPNVFYEAGIAHTLGKHVIPITQNQEHIPFDLRHHRFAIYLNNIEGRTKLQTDLKDRLNILKNKQHLSGWA